jgi:hypothetical protein
VVDQSRGSDAPADIVPLDFFLWGFVNVDVYMGKTRLLA